MVRITALRKEAPRPNIPNLVDASPEYAALVAKRDKLDAQRQQLETEQSRLMDELARETVSLARRERDQRVALLLDDESAASISRPHARLSEINRELGDLKIAVEVLRDKISQARVRASEGIRKGIRTEYGRRVEACCNALLQLREAAAAYFELVDELSAKDINWTPLNPMPVGFCGNPGDRYSKYGLYLREAAQHNYFDYAKIPNELR